MVSIYTPLQGYNEGIGRAENHAHELCDSKFLLDKSTPTEPSGTDSSTCFSYHKKQSKLNLVVESKAFSGSMAFS